MSGTTTAARVQLRIAFERCPLCDHGEADVLGTASCARHPLYRPPLPEALRWLRCTACGHVFADGHFTDEALAILFADANSAQLPGASVIGPQRLVSARIVERVVQLRASSEGTWLDVGFGNGALLTTAAEFGFTAIGLDLRAQAVHRLASLGIEAHCIPLERFAPPRPVNVISFADVLEHMPFPRVALARAHALLESDGLLFASMPNLDCFEWQALDVSGTNPYWGEIEHVHNFGRRRLHALLRQHGFEPVSYAVSERYVAGMEIIARKGAVPA